MPHRTLHSELMLHETRLRKATARDVAAQGNAAGSKPDVFLRVHLAAPSQDLPSGGPVGRSKPRPTQPRGKAAPHFHHSSVCRGTSCNRWPSAAAVAFRRKLLQFRASTRPRTSAAGPSNVLRASIRMRRTPRCRKAQDAGLPDAATVRRSLFALPRTPHVWAPRHHHVNRTKSTEPLYAPPRHAKASRHHQTQPELPTPAGDQPAKAAASTPAGHA